MEAGKKVVDSPIHLADFGAALTSGDTELLQQVLECPNVSNTAIGIILINVFNKQHPPTNYL